MFSIIMHYKLLKDLSDLVSEKMQAKNKPAAK
jgi:hypothetical protein